VCLYAEGYSLNRVRDFGETGVDIEARHGTAILAIEVIGYKSSPPARAKDFYEAFFRAVSRLNDGATRCVIALPDRFRVGLPARAKQHRVAWGQVADAFPELEIWLVNPENRSYQISGWGTWLEQQGLRVSSSPPEVTNLETR